MPDAASLYQIIGLAGFLAYMAGFAGLQLGKLDGNGAAYAWSNIIGASLVLVSLVHAFNLASLLIQISWIFFGIVGLLRRAKARSARPAQAHFVRRAATARPRRLDRGLSVL